MGAEVKADVGTKLSDGALPKMEALPADLLSQITFDCRGFQDTRSGGSNSPAVDIVATHPSESEPSVATANTLEARKQAFLDTYSVRVLDGGPNQVSFTIPEGKSRMDLIKGAHELIEALYNRLGVYPPSLAAWQKDPQFTQAAEKATPVAVEGCVPHSTNMTRAEQEEKGWCNVDMRDLAAAQQAFFVATGRDIFDDKIVRARGGALCFYGLGLDVNFCIGVFRYYDVAGSRSLPAPN